MVQRVRTVRGMRTGHPFNQPIKSLKTRNTKQKTETETQGTTKVLFRPFFCCTAVKFGEHVIFSVGMI